MFGEIGRNYGKYLLKILLDFHRGSYIQFCIGYITLYQLVEYKIL